MLFRWHKIACITCTANDDDWIYSMVETHLQKETWYLICSWTFITSHKMVENMGKSPFCAIMVHVVFQSKIRILMENGSSRLHINANLWTVITIHRIAWRLPKWDTERNSVVQTEKEREMSIGFCILIEKKIRPFEVISNGTYKRCDFISWADSNKPNSILFACSFHHSFIDQRANRIRCTQLPGKDLLVSAEKDEHVRPIETHNLFPFGCASQMMLRG